MRVSISSEIPVVSWLDMPQGRPVYDRLSTTPGPVPLCRPNVYAMSHRPQLRAFSACSGPECTKINLDIKLRACSRCKVARYCRVCALFWNLTTHTDGTQTASVHIAVSCQRATCSRQRSSQAGMGYSSTRVGPRYGPVVCAWSMHREKSAPNPGALASSPHNTILTIFVLVFHLMFRYESGVHLYSNMAFIKHHLEVSQTTGKYMMEGLVMKLA